MHIKKCGFIVYHYNTLDPLQKFHKHSKSQTYTTIKKLENYKTKRNRTKQNKNKNKRRRKNLSYCSLFFERKGSDFQLEGSYLIWVFDL